MVHKCCLIFFSAQKICKQKVLAQLRQSIFLGIEFLCKLFFIFLRIFLYFSMQKNFFLAIFLVQVLLHVFVCSYMFVALVGGKKI